MIAMQYSFTLPADYDMAIIEKRITENGAKLDQFPGLVFKTYLYARQDDLDIPSRENLYAPLYLWQDTQSMINFLSSEGFTILTRTFGWPNIQSWLVYKYPDAQWVKKQNMAQRVITSIPSYTDLSKILNITNIGDLLAWNSNSMQNLQINFRQNLPQIEDDITIQSYRIGYTAT